MSRHRATASTSIPASVRSALGALTAVAAVVGIALLGEHPASGPLVQPGALEPCTPTVTTTADDRAWHGCARPRSREEDAP